MRVRCPNFTFNDSVPHWGGNREACTVINAGGIIPPPIERYLIKVMRQAKPLFDPEEDADLLANISVFSQQEAQHFKFHTDYLEMLRTNGYSRIREFEAAFEADLEEFLATRDLAWNLAYGEGFESSGTAMAEGWLDGRVKDLCADHGSVPMQLWMWHMAEEFEHRSVVHDVMHRLYGPERCFELRTTVGAFARGHYGNHAARAAAYLYEVDRASMTDEEVALSLVREKETWIAYGSLFGKSLRWIFDRDYNPSAVAPPAGYESIIAAYS
jgi:predicted metal-dependent hydrolase